MQRSNKPLNIEEGATEDAAELAIFYASYEDAEESGEGQDEVYLDQAKLDRFFGELDDVYDAITDYPELYGFYEKPLRRCYFPRLEN
ncbi:MAG: hypothetical protein P1V97_22515 [Planctomycetota bacterium]|nr:hypothetical protein [Planctomycetota bacterium]